jgi:hypothetical protein
MSGQRRPRRVSDNPWLAWGCGVPTLGCLFGGLAVGIAFSVAFWTWIFGGGLVAVVIAELIVFGGIAGLLYGASKYDRW